MDIDAMRKAAAQAGAMLRTLGNEDRLLLLCRLSQGEMAVSELAQALAIRQPTLSQQLGVLREEGAGLHPASRQADLLCGGRCQSAGAANDPVSTVLPTAGEPR